MRDAVLALDQGTTGSTALLFSHAGEILGRGYREIPQHYPRPGWVEHDADDLYRCTLEAATEALADAQGTADSVVAIGLTNQRETTVVWERATGRPVGRAVVWQSRQTTDICRRLERDGLEPHVRATTGLRIDAYFSATKIRWLLDQDPSLQARAERGELLCGTVDSWLLFRLTGGRVHATEPTNASRTMLFDIHRRRWDGDLLAALEIPRAMLPRVAESSAEVFGRTTAQGSLPAGLPIAGIAGDQQSALYGQGCWTPGTAKNTYGTGCFLVMNTGDRAIESEGGLLTSLACDDRGWPLFCLEGSIFTAGAAVQWLRDELRLIHNAEETGRLARSVEDTAGVYLVPAFSGLGAPHWDMDARGALIGLTRGAGRAHIIRAALESIAYQTRDVLEAMNAELMACEDGASLQELRVDGGASANNFLMQFQADIAGVPVDRPQLVETTAMGAAFLAGLAVGFWDDPQAVSAARHRERRFEPSMDDTERDRLYRGWQDAIARVLTRGDDPAGS